MTFHAKGDLTQQRYPMPRWVQHAAWRLWSRGWQGITPWLAAVCFAFVTTPAASQGLVAANKPFIVTAGGEPDTWGSRLGWLIYTEAFKRLGMAFRMEHYTLARGAAMVEQGQADAELSRVYEYGAERPYLVRVDESIVDLGFSLYTAKPALRMVQLDDLRTSQHLVEYRRGLLLCESTLRPLVAPERLTDVATREQGLKKLLAGRTDLYCEIDVYVQQELHTPEFKDLPNVANVRKLISLGKSVPTYPYLHKKHAELAPRLATVLRQMKAQGLIETYQRQVERDLGWVQ
ncbi:hypothetical protein [Rhodoferax sp.]|uniref:hypothetical protein n=1 Tax=Rhodoferax sp. TaxID=50421 RepID=UPI00271D42BA|nr:hypothetical protein [Rhodoferax sp.]MDO8319977.1 hypothetical protein [Rhodoferax sp.]MDP2678159.1 hypothetical protein [Rhodoferax sp.]